MWPILPLMQVIQWYSYTENCTSMSIISRLYAHQALLFWLLATDQIQVFPYVKDGGCCWYVGSVFFLSGVSLYIFHMEVDLIPFIFLNKWKTCFSWVFDSFIFFLLCIFSKLFRYSIKISFLISSYWHFY